MLLDIAIADAYAAGFEFATPDVLAQRPNTFLCYYTRNVDGTHAGRYTDDTQMSIALVRWILTYHKNPLASASLQSFAELMVDTFHRDPRKTYSRRMFNYLKSHLTAESFLQDRIPTSESSGAAMRSAVLGFLSPNVVKVVAPLQASLTHDTDKGKAASLVVAYISSLVRRGYPFEYAIIQSLELVRSLYPGLDIVWDAPPAFPVSYMAVDVVQAAIFALRLHWYEPQLMLRTIVDWGGNIDTVAAIATGIRANAGPINWPQWTKTQLEKGSYGYEYLKRLDGLLEKTFGLSKSPAITP